MVPSGRLQTCTLVLTLLSIYVPVALAQVIEEVVVTAQKREQREQDVGISMTTFSPEQIRQLRLFNSEELARQTPNLQATSFSGDPTVMLFAIRGVGQNDFGDHHEGPTAIYIDEAYVSALGAVGFQIFDLERVEVLRGPQGTLFGRNATGGLVQYITAKPTDTLDAYLDLTMGEYNLRRLEGAISGPLGDRARLRLSVLSNQSDGYLSNRIGPDVHEVDGTAARLQFEYDFTPDFDMLLKLHGAEDNNSDVGAFGHRAAIPGPDGLGDFLPDNVNADLFGLGSCPGCDPIGYKDTDGDPWAGEYDQPGKFNRDAYGTTLRLTLERENYTFTSLTDLLDLEKTYGEDSDGSPNPLLFFESSQDLQHLSQEFRLNGGNDRLDWTAGFFYLDIDGDYTSVLGSPLFDATQLNIFDLETTSWAVFGQVEYDFTPAWRIIAGLRWTEDEKKYTFDPACTGTGCVGFFVFPGSGTVSDIGGFNEMTVGSLATLDDGDWAGKLQLEWTDENVLVYGGITRGHKAGGFNAPVDGLLLPQEMIYESEILTNYEIGFKSTLAENRVTLNGAAFYYDYDNKQAFTFSGLTSYLLNRPSEASGLELELAARPAEELDIVFGLATLDATVDNIPLPSGLMAKQDAAQSPELTVNGLLRKGWPVGTGMLDVIVDGSYVSEQYFNTINHRTARSDSYSLWNARVEYTGADNRWNLGFFLNNITDEDVITYAIDVSAFGYSLQSFGPPRWFGAQFRYSWQR